MDLDPGGMGASLDLVLMRGALRELVDAGVLDQEHVRVATACYVASLPSSLTPEAQEALRAQARQQRHRCAAQRERVAVQREADRRRRARMAITRARLHGMLRAEVEDPR